MTFATLMKEPSAALPVSMSSVALVLVLGHLILFGPVHEVDEGTAAHLFHLLVVAQMPIVAWFAIRWLPRTPRQALQVLALQAGTLLAAFAPVFLFRL